MTDINTAISDLMEWDIADIEKSIRSLPESNVLARMVLKEVINFITAIDDAAKEERLLHEH